jgi:hypothetical protein
MVEAPNVPPTHEVSVVGAAIALTHIKTISTGVGESATLPEIAKLVGVGVGVTVGVVVWVELDGAAPPPPQAANTSITATAMSFFMTFSSLNISVN